MQEQMENATPDEEQFPDTFYSWLAAHPERFAQRLNMKRRILYGIGAAVCVLLVIWPSVIPLLPLWLIRVAAVLVGLYCGLMSYADGVEWYDLRSGGEIKQRTRKYFDNSFVKRSQILSAFEKRDFNFMLDAETAENQPIMLEIHEDAVGRTFFMIVMKYFSAGDLRAITDVMEVSGTEYARWAGVIRSIKSTN